MKWNISFFQPPTVSSRKPILFPNSGQNPQIYQYYHLGDILPEKYELKVCTKLNIESSTKKVT